MQTYTYVEKDEDGNVVLEEERDYISIATTRPETMLGDGAVAVHPSDERYAPIVGKLCEIPVGPKEHRRLIPIITDEYPDPDFGSGAVKITGAHDFNDYEVAKRGGIPMYRLMDTKGAMRDDGLPYAECAARRRQLPTAAQLTESRSDTINLVPDDLRGLDRFEAAQAVVEQITAEGLAVMIPAIRSREASADRRALVENKPIMQPFGDRSKVVIEPMLTDQWFVDTAKIVGPRIDAVRNGDHGSCPSGREGLFPLAGEHRTLVHLAPALVGAPDPGVVRARPVGAGFQDDEGDGASTWSNGGFCRGMLHGRRHPLRADFGGHARSDELADLPPAEPRASSRSPTARRHRSLPRALPTTRHQDPTIWSTRSGATPTFSTPGSPPASGPSARWAGPKRPGAAKILPDLRADHRV